MQLVKCNCEWSINFCDHQPLSFSSKEDLEKYLNGECSNEHGYMEYERVPDYVRQTIDYEIVYEE